MKRYLVFAGEYYYPGEGWKDFVGDFDTAEEAHAEAARLALTLDPSTGKTTLDWAQVVDLETGAACHHHRRVDNGAVCTENIRASS